MSSRLAGITSVKVPEPEGAATGVSPGLLRRFLEAYWLRPENAFWMRLRSEALSAHSLERPSVDISCGDGVFSFLHTGGVFHPAFDVFTAVTALDRVSDKHADMFDHTSDAYQPQITNSPVDRIDLGTDLKPALLAKAGSLDLYDRLILSDNNNPLPLSDGSVQTVYCNSAYWVANIDGFLGELRRITRPGGRIILHVKLDTMRRCTLERHRDAFGDRFLRIIGRGRLDSWPSLASREVWESRFAGSRLNIESRVPFVTRTHAHIWDIGLRPIAPMLVRMANGLTPETRASIKRDWVDLVCELLEPLCNPDLDLLPGSGDPAEIQYVLTPQ